MKHLIVGASGLLGSALLKESLNKSNKAQGTFLSYPLEGLVQLDYGDKDEVEKVLDSFKPDVIFCPAGKTNVDWIEENSSEANNLNITKLRILFEEASKRNIPVAFFSTDYLFDGKSGPYSEDDEPNPLNVYGKHKLAAERMLQAIMPDNHYVFRTTWVFGHEKQEKNFVYSLMKNLNSGKEMEIPENMIATPSYAVDVAKAAIQIVESGKSGVYNLSGNETLSRFDFAKLIADVFNLDGSLIKSIQHDQSSRPADRPLKAGLKNDKATKLINMRWTSLKDSLIETKKSMEHVGQLPHIKNEINSKICIFIPCYNATATLPKVLERIPAQIKEKVEEVFVVDNASEDFTYLMAVGYREEKNKDIKNLKIFKNETNFGYGGSQKLAYAYAIKEGYDMVVMLHGDAQYAPEKLPVMIEKMENDKSIDLLFGSRMAGDPLAGGMPVHRYWGNRALTWIQNFLLGSKISEFHSGYRIYRTESLKKVPFHLCSSDYHFDTEIIIQFINKKLNIGEVTIQTYYGDEKNYVNIWKYGLQVCFVTLCYFLFKNGLRNIPKYELYNKEKEADIDHIFENFKTEIY